MGHRLTFVSRISLIEIALACKCSRGWRCSQPDGVVASPLCSSKAGNLQFRIGWRKQKAIRNRKQGGSQRDRICIPKAQVTAAPVSSLWKLLARSSIVGPGTSGKMPQLGSGEWEPGGDAAWWRRKCRPGVEVASASN